MKKKKKLRLQNTDRRKPIKYADIDTEDFYGEDIESDQEEQFDTDDEDEYMVAYSSEDKTVGTYRQEEMQEYADEYASELENETYEAEEYETEEYESEEYEEVEEYEETKEYESEG